MRGKKLLAVLSLVVLAALPSCGRKPVVPADSAPKKQTGVSVQEEAAPQPPPAAANPEPAAEEPKEKVDDNLPTAPPDSALRFPIHKDLTTALHLYVMDNRKMPANFETLVKERYVKEAPKAPPGKHFAVDRRRMQVVIID
jgi:hypothetical protein